MHIREHWFDEGAPLFRQVLEESGGVLPPGDFYMCPLCTLAFSREAVAETTPQEERALSEEHVPPGKAGGQGLLLTCTSCNNTHGSRFDSHEVIRRAMRNAAKGENPGRDLRASLEVDGIEMPCKVCFIDGKMIARGQGTHPDNAEAHAEALKRAQEAKDFSSVKFRFRQPHDPGRADVSLIRSAYLAAFTALGWSYILKNTLTTLSPIRDKLEKGSAASHALTLRSLVGRRPSLPDGGRKITLVEQPPDLESVLVTIDQNLVFLPDPWGIHSCVDLSQAIGRHRDSQGENSVTLNGKDVPWPSPYENRFRLDRI
ncbi:hypothetical protein HUT18_03485 [Streptomyces sp. NA04227]|uniref:hypothetical protein n=1 Tax=Streptomyces sp. NA04227 TaxID=2742136 RepID=UPI001591AF25|nr:hypothetical protein [Streptomyces sp. NA04227]QKW05575.1 hypothetical protein HUT18_03485 [Streptomyces sp. NA04227]